MKRILVVLAALVLVFAVACDGDNPSPSGGGNQGGSDNPGQTIPGDVEIPDVTDEAFPSEQLSPIIYGISALVPQNSQPASQEFNSTYEYYSSDDKLLAKSVTENNGESKVTIEIDGYSILSKGAVISISTEDYSYDLSKLTQIKVNDKLYIKGQAGFDEAQKELMDLVEKCSYTSSASATVSKFNVTVSGSQAVLTSTTTTEIVYDGFYMSMSAEQPGSGYVASQYMLDRAFQNEVKGYTKYLIFENATQDNPSAFVIQIHGGQYDGKAYSISMTSGM